MTNPEIHPMAARGFSTGADRYERGRASYPLAAVDFVVDQLELQPGRLLVEVGAGTGKLTRLLVHSGAEIVAVEPVAEMRSHLVSNAPGVHAVDGMAEALPLPDDSADAAVVAQAFHWFDGPAALRELHRVLRPGTHLSLVWNVRDEREPWVADLTRLFDEHGGNAPRFRTGAWRAAFTPGCGFRQTDEVEVGSRHVASLDAQRDLAMSVSFIAALPDDLRARFEERLSALLETVVDADRRVALPYRTQVFVFARQ